MSSEKHSKRLQRMSRFNRKRSIPGLALTPFPPNFALSRLPFDFTPSFLILRCHFPDFPELKGMNMPPLDINHLYRRYGSMVFRRCRSLLRDEVEAKDAMQDTFVRLIQAHGTLNQEFPSSLLYRIATHAALDRIRTRKRHPEDRDERLLASIADESDMEGRLTAGRFLGRLFGREEESSRVMAVLHFVDGLTLEEVAEQCGFSVSGVRKRLRKIRELALSLKAKEEREVIP